MYGLNRAHGRGGPGHPVCDVSQDVSSSFLLQPIIRPVQECSKPTGNKVKGRKFRVKRGRNWPMLDKQGTLAGLCHDYARKKGFSKKMTNSLSTFIISGILRCI